MEVLLAAVWLARAAPAAAATGRSPWGSSSPRRGSALGVLISHPSWWLSFPPTLRAIQFTFRLVSYLALVTTLGVIVLLRAPALRRSRAAMAALVLICGWQAGLALDLALTSKARGGEPHTAPSPANIRAGTVPTAFAAGLLQASQFRLVVARPLSPTATSAQVAPVGDDTPARRSSSRAARPPPRSCPPTSSPHP